MPIIKIAHILEFSIYLLFTSLAAMNNLFYFGLITGIAILLAFGADIILAPALIALAVGRKQNNVPPVSVTNAGE